MSRTPRKKVPLKIKKEARRLFESGMTMYDVAIELKLNINTLYNLSSKEGWIRGRLEELLYIKEQEALVEDIAVRKVYRLKKYRELTDGITAIASNIQNIMKRGKVQLNMKENIAFANHVKAIQGAYELDRELYGIMSPREEIELDTQRIKLEKLKHKLDEGEDIEL